MKEHNYNEADIQKYLLGEMSGEEKQAFEKVLETDTVLAQVVKEQGKVVEGIEFFAAQEFKGKLQDLYAEVRPEIIDREVAAPRPRRWLFMGLALVAILVALFFAYRYLQPQPAPAPEQLFAQYYQAYDWNPVLRNEALPPPINQALDFYDTKAYTKALPLLQQLSQERPQDIPTRLALVSSLLANQQASLALPHLEEIAQRNDILYQDQVRWYTALAYLQSDQIAEAKAALQILAQNKNADYHRAAQDLMKDLP